MVKFQDLCGDEKKALAEKHPTTKFVFIIFITLNRVAGLGALSWIGKICMTEQT